MGTKPVTPPFVRLHSLPERKHVAPTSPIAIATNRWHHGLDTFHNLGIDPKENVTPGPCTHGITLCWATGLSGPQILHARIPPVHGVPQQHAASQDGRPPSTDRASCCFASVILREPALPYTIRRWGQCVSSKLFFND